MEFMENEKESMVFFTHVPFHIEKAADHLEKPLYVAHDTVLMSLHKSCIESSGARIENTRMRMEV